MITPRYISELLGAPMAAIVQAEAIAAKATADFIKEVGFTNENDSSDPEFGTVRNISFSYNRINADGSSDITSISVPLLTIIPIPSIQVAEAEIEFDLALTQPDTKTSGTTGTGGHFVTLKDHLKLKGIIGKKPGGSNPAGSNNATANMNVKIRLAQSELSVGMVQLLNILDSAKKEN